MIQWHPLFADLLRPLLAEYYEILTNVPVGDLPREADIVLLRRRSAGQLPFEAIWRHLTQWNVLEFKAPTVSARLEDVPTLVELGLGIHRRLNEKRKEEKRPRLQPREVSFWYLANHLGKRYHHYWRERLDLQPVEEGIWKCLLIEHPLYLVSRADLAVDAESVPLHVLAREARDKELAVAKLIAQRPLLWKHYAEWVMSFHPQSFEELRLMAKSRTKEFRIHLEPLIDLLGMDEVIRQVGKKKLVEAIGGKEIVEALGEKKIVEALGEKKLAEHLDWDRFLSALTPSQRREIKRRLEKA